MQIHGFIKSTLLDYPKHLAATVFVGGCNIAAPCHNASLVLRPHLSPSYLRMICLTLIQEKHLEEYVLPRRADSISGFVPLLNKLKSLTKGKLDTNGTNPSLMMKLN